MHYFSLVKRSSWGPLSVIVTPFYPSFVSMNMRVESFIMASGFSDLGLGKLRNTIFSQYPRTFDFFLIYSSNFSNLTYLAYVHLAIFRIKCIFIL